MYFLEYNESQAQSYSDLTSTSYLYFTGEFEKSTGLPIYATLNVPNNYTSPDAYSYIIAEDNEDVDNYNIFTFKGGIYKSDEKLTVEVNYNKLLVAGKPSLVNVSLNPSSIEGSTYTFNYNSKNANAYTTIKVRTNGNYFRPVYYVKNAIILGRLQLDKGQWLIRVVHIVLI